MKKIILNGLVSFLLILLLPFAAMAHELEAGPNGGAFADIGSHHLEVVLTQKNLKLFVTDAAESPVDVAGATGNAIILAGAQKSSAKLSPSGGHVMNGQVTIEEAGPYTIVVIVKLASGEGLQAKFKVNKFSGS